MGLLYTLTLLLNALLLFLVQPMIAKMLLPSLGGTPAVWNTCMVFFQTMLLCGYAYSHFVTKKLSLKPQIIVHLALFIGAALVFPFEISEKSLQSLSNGAQPISWMLGQLFLLVGLPFLMLATSGPLLQQWFSQTDHPSAKDPYFLYSASNVGSLLALVGYPLLLEPTLRLRQQSLTWAVCYVTLLSLLGACAAIRWRAAKPVAQPTTDEAPREAAPLNWPQRGRWVLLSFVPSSLMLGVTTHLSTDISPFPLLWVVPLALYLITFILAFAKRQWISTARLAQGFPFLGIALAFVMFSEEKHALWLSVGLPLLFFFCTALLCHRQLAETRPATLHLTEFYVWLSVGGTLGGLFNSLLAPFIFNRVLEYPLMVIVALLLRPRSTKAAAVPLRSLWERSLDYALPAALGLLTFLLVYSLPYVGVPKMPAVALSLGVPAVIGLGFITKPIRFGLAMAAILFGGSSYLGLLFGQTLHQSRNFFGVQRVAVDQTGTMHDLSHGSTRHGRQYIDPKRQCEPVSYYHQNGPVGQWMTALREQPLAKPNVAIVGLGTGALISYAKPGEDWTFYEIDPDVIQIAAHSGHFTYLKNCSAASNRIVMGDARLQLRNAPDRHYGLIVLDAFSSDGIPVHLLTKEALDLYLAKLADGGRLVMHISNVYLDLRQVVSALAQSANLSCLVNDDFSAQMVNAAPNQDPSTWVVLARRAEDLGSLSQHPQWHRFDNYAKSKLWTDDYSNILSVFRRN